MCWSRSCAVYKRCTVTPTTNHIGENPKLSDPDWNHLNHALQELEFLVVQELFLSETAQVADVVFSASALAEKEGTFTNTERRCMKFDQAVEPLGDTLADWEILARLGTAMGYPMHYENSSLTTGRMFAHFHTGTMTRVSPHLDIEQQDGYVEMSPSDAQKMDVKDGDLLTICSRRGELDVPARLTDTIEPGTLFLPIHFGENPANILTSSEAFDPLAKIPEFKVSAVSVRKSPTEIPTKAAV